MDCVAACTPLDTSEAFAVAFSSLAKISARLEEKAGVRLAFGAEPTATILSALIDGAPSQDASLYIAKTVEAIGSRAYKLRSPITLHPRLLATVLVGAEFGKGTVKLA